MNNNINENEIEKAESTAAETDTDAEKARESKKNLKSFFDIFEMFAVCTAVILLMFSYVARLTVVEGASMEDTLHHQDYLIVQDIGYTPQRGDIVVIQKISAPSYSKPIIKRVIAVEGDVIEIELETWTVKVNGEVIDEPYANFELGRLYNDFGNPMRMTIEPGKIFVMGDHRNHSSDSRVAQIGQVDVRCVVGRAVLRILPFDSFGILERAKYD